MLRSLTQGIYLGIPLFVKIGATPLPYTCHYVVESNCLCGEAPDAAAYTDMMRNGRGIGDLLRPRSFARALKCNETKDPGRVAWPRPSLWMLKP